MKFSQSQNRPFQLYSEVKQNNGKKSFKYPKLHGSYLTFSEHNKKVNYLVRKRCE